MPEAGRKREEAGDDFEPHAIILPRRKISLDSGMDSVTLLRLAFFTSTFLTL
jgi:hypothetical protein